MICQCSAAAAVVVAAVVVIAAAVAEAVAAAAEQDDQDDNDPEAVVISAHSFQNPFSAPGCDSSMGCIRGAGKRMYAAVIAASVPDEAGAEASSAPSYAPPFRAVIVICNGNADESAFGGFHKRFPMFIAR